MGDLTVDLSGTYREQGRQHGEALASIIGEILSEVLKKDTWEAPKVEWLFCTVEANLGREAPGVMEEMRGIAEGSGQTYKDILAYNALADIWMVHAFCSSLGWAETPDGPVVGKTNDIGQHREKYHHPFRRRSGEGLPAVWATWPGTVWSNCFVNAHGVTHGGASLGMRSRNEQGIPSNCMYRIAMDRCTSVEEVVSLCESLPVMHHPSHNVLADATGTLLALELTPEGCFVCQPPGRSYARVTNHFCPGPYEGRDTNDARLVENSRRRFANFARLAESLTPCVESMVSVLRDHAEVGQICQHDNDGMSSSAAYVTIPTQRRMLIARGQPCESTFAEVAL